MAADYGPFAGSVLKTIDSLLQERAVVLGSLPPRGRDIDLAVGPEDAAAIVSRLLENGFNHWRGRWIAFRDCSVSILDVVPAARMDLPALELSALRSEGRPLPGLTNIVEPAPHHVLLILARKLAHERHSLASKHRAQIDRVLATDPAAWEAAKGRASFWGAGRSLRRLESRHRGVSIPWRLPAPGSRATRVVAFSGPDASARSSHAELLRRTLDRLGLEAVVERPDLPADGLGVGAALCLWRSAWRHVGRGRIVIFERYALDWAVPAGRAGQERNVAARMRILRLLSPAPSCAYFLDLPGDPVEEADDAAAQASQLYRAEAERFDVRCLDRRRPTEELCEQVAKDVLCTLERRAALRSIARVGRWRPVSAPASVGSRR